MNAPGTGAVRRVRRARELLAARARGRRPGGELGLFHEFAPPPSGGGHQFLRALTAEIERRGIGIESNGLSKDTRACLVNSFNFDPGLLRRLLRDDVRVVHRVDGPVTVYRGRDDGTDALVARLNGEFADATIFQSRYSLESHRALGFELVAPTVISNAPDPAIFHAEGRVAFDADRPVRLVSASWSDNPNKGATVLAELERLLDRSRFELTFVGRHRAALAATRTLPPLLPSALADVLRQSDVYIAPSLHDPCSNAVLEALACGLPVIYADSGGHPELVGDAGFAFTSADEIPALLDRLVDEYDARRRRIVVPSLATVATRYLAELGLADR